MAERNRPHILVRAGASVEGYTKQATGGGAKATPAPPDRAGHARNLLNALDSAERDGTNRRALDPIRIEGARPGTYVTFESFPGMELALTALDPQRGRVHAELMSVQERDTASGVVQLATVFVPEGKLSTFVKKVEAYAGTVADEKPKSRAFVDPISEIALATLRALWTDQQDEFPSAGKRVWWEVWLRTRDGNEVDRLTAFAAARQCEIGQTRLAFKDRVIVLVLATPEQLATAIDVLDDLSELRRPHEPGALLSLEPADEQADWVRELADRLKGPSDDSPSVCVLDTGVHSAHPLLSSALAADDEHTYDPNWKLNDHAGHGTEMAGLALFDNLRDALASGTEIRLRHKLESVKVLPPQGQNPPELYGAITAVAASLVEIQAPDRRRTYSMAITSPSNPATREADAVRLGEPTSWSAAIDALAAGRAIDISDDDLVYLDEDDEATPRLFVVSAGNVRSFDDDHLTRSDLEPVEDPAQAWNVLTVGAFTELSDLSTKPSYAGWTAVAKPGELSPHSRTSVAFNRTWPVKPDVVMEGGNIARSPAGTEFDSPTTFGVLTTKAPLRDQRLLTVSNATSAATAQAAHLASSVMAAYPGLWPETVRALMVHSARWTPAMRQRFDRESGKRERDSLRRRYGMGVPDLTRATRSAADSLTLIVQDSIRPFDGQSRMREMHLHELPWPGDVLADLGETQVQMRVTLSYFIEPNPARRGWVHRFRYQSHGLRFDLRRATESTSEFRKRINDQALDDGERRPPPAEADGSEWTFGSRHRGTGSLHTDIWTGRAADLARRGVLALYPVTGWWKEIKSRDASERGARYGLIISIEAPDQDVDIWTPVAQQVGVPIEIET